MCPNWKRGNVVERESSWFQEVAVTSASNVDFSQHLARGGPFSEHSGATRPPCISSRVLSRLHLSEHPRFFCGPPETLLLCGLAALPPVIPQEHIHTAFVCSSSPLPFSQLEGLHVVVCGQEHRLWAKLSRLKGPARTSGEMLVLPGHFFVQGMNWYVPATMVYLALWKEKQTYFWMGVFPNSCMLFF